MQVMACEGGGSTMAPGIGTHSTNNGAVLDLELRDGVAESVAQLLAALDDAVAHAELEIISRLCDRAMRAIARVRIEIEALRGGVPH
jgi:hypothetical protein